MTIIIYATNWCPDCLRVKHFLTTKKFPFQWVNIDYDYSAEQLVLKLNQGYRSVPTLIFPDGSILVEPSNAELASKLGT